MFMASFNFGHRHNLALTGCNFILPRHRGGGAPRVMQRTAAIVLASRRRSSSPTVSEKFPLLRVGFGSGFARLSNARQIVTDFWIFSRILLRFCNFLPCKTLRAVRDYFDSQLTGGGYRVD